VTAKHVHGLMVDLLAFRKRQAMPFEGRAAAFVAGLRALTRQTGVVALVMDYRDGALDGSIVLRDVVACPAGDYEGVGDSVSWERTKSPEEKALLTERDALLATLHAANTDCFTVADWQAHYAPLHEIDRRLRAFPITPSAAPSAST